MPSPIPVRRNVLHRRVPVSAGTAYVGPGDISSGAYVWFGFRAYNSAYRTGTKHLVDLVDQAGSNPITIDCKADGTFDSTTYNNWVTAHTVTTPLVTKLYDQTGNGRHLVQATLAHMPTLNPTGVVSLSMAGSFGGTFMSAVSAFTLSQPFSLSAVANRVTIVGGFEVFMENDNTGGGLYFNPHISTDFTIGIASMLSSNTVLPNTPGAIQFLVLTGTNTSKVYVDGTQTLGDAGTFAFASEGFDLNGSQVDVIKFTEGGFWASDTSGNFSTMNTNQHTFWGF